jgi:sec-independent protein translocase protein TatC
LSTLAQGRNTMDDHPEPRVVEEAGYSFWDHLNEARNGIIRSLVYVFWLLEWPAWQGAKWAGVEQFNFRIFEPIGGLMIMMYAALVVGATVAAPLWLWEVMRFINPALTTRERKFTFVFIPGFVGLFTAGVVFCYFLAAAFCWFLLRFNLISFQVAPEWTLGSYLRFLLQCLVSTGLLFELPVLVMFLVWIGVTNSNALRARWRGAIVTILIVVAAVSPTTDPITMTVMALPMIGLYFLSISLARWVERGRAEALSGSEQETAAPSTQADF